MRTRRAAGWGVVGAAVLALCGGEGGGSPSLRSLGLTGWALIPSAQAEESIEPAARAETGGKGVAGKAAAKETSLKAATAPGAAPGLAKAAKAGPVEAAKAPVPGKVEAPADQLTSLTAELRRAGSPTDEQAAAAAAQKLGALASPAANEVLLGELSTGLSPKVAMAALDALAAQKVAAADVQLLPVLSLYARHRNLELRRRAVTAVAALPESPASAGTVVPLLVGALGDASSEVRAVAAQALGARHEKSAEPALIKLLLRKDPAAPAALGQVGGPDTARALSEMIGNVPDRMILETLGELLKRPDFGPEQVRVQVVKTIGKMPGSQTLDILTDYVKQTAPAAAQAAGGKPAAKAGKDAPKEGPRPSRIEAQKIIEQRTAK